ncbi:BON domain-containing protein [Nannocystis bainbridge]|uniref:BON domain-containing protein n=1 Tax=Nannocystis bainbridge TaxID=2995303 RepID=A0ABT5DU69_9BACT|nr:BON domain-containing protein [Nannocystis bainbridge]MDC0717194.1 BON domain-containing protein [Nannocystis bainbridge]
MELEADLSPDHTGRGPRGYRRSDESIRDDLHVILTAHDEIDASDVEVLVERGEVLLRGNVRRRATKRLVEDIAYQIGGVRDVTNLLRIGPPAAPRPQPEQFADDDVESKLRSTTKDDHPSRRDAWISEHLRDRGTLEEELQRTLDRRDLRSHAYTGPRDTSAGERITAPERPLIVPEPRWPAPTAVDEEVELENKDLDAEELKLEDVDEDATGS